MSIAVSSDGEIALIMGSKWPSSCVVVDDVALGRDQEIDAHKQS